ncbi:MAG: LysM peptidoglycan-binding domain-containing protein [Actinomycetota bacterium]
MAILAGVVVFAFLIGRVTGGGGGGTSSATTASLQTKVNTLQSENSRLSAALANAGNSTGTNTGTNGGSTTGGSTTGGSTTPTSTTTSPSPPSSSSTVGPNGTTYQVKAGDSLSTIEAHFYHAIGAQYTAAIEAANNMTSSAIRTGQTLTIPPASAITNSSSTGTVTSPSPPATGTSPGTTTHPTPTKK